jgi:hypothetical protein
MRPLLLWTTAAQTIHWGDHLLSRSKRLECDLGTPAFTVRFATSPLLLFVGSRPRRALLGRACSRRLAMAQHRKPTIDLLGRTALLAPGGGSVKGDCRSRDASERDRAIRVDAMIFMAILQLRR